MDTEAIVSQWEARTLYASEASSERDEHADPETGTVEATDVFGVRRQRHL